MRQHAERALRRERIRGEIDAADARRARIGPQHGRQDAQARRFAGAVWPEQTRDPAVQRFEAHGVDGLHLAEPLADAVDLDHGAGPSRLKKNGVGGSRIEAARVELGRRRLLEERAQQPRHAADADQAVALAAADQVHAVAQALGLARAPHRRAG